MSFSSHYFDPATASRKLRDGGVVAIPTETVYGLAAVATCIPAVQRVFKIKQRPAMDPLIVHIAHSQSLSEIAREIPDEARLLARQFWPGPLTLVLPRHPSIPDIVTAGRDTVAIRVPAHPIAHDILRQTALPLAAPSANPFGGVSPTCAQHVREQLGPQIDGIVDGGPCSVGLESTIIGFWDSKIWLLRHGGIPVETIEALVGPLNRYRPTHANDVRAPGTMPRHYAPATPLVLSPANTPTTSPEKIARLIFGPPEPARQHHPGPLINLSPEGNLQEAARNLYQAIRTLDAAGADLIIADLVPQQGMGRAVNDRLRRAAAS